MWKRYWADSSETDLPTIISEKMEATNAREFMFIHAVLHMLLLLPVTSAEVERAHSAFKLRMCTKKLSLERLRSKAARRRRVVH